MEELFDPIRHSHVAALPEEKVRQQLLFFMMKELGYPKRLLCVEKDIGQLPHLCNKSRSFPRRRIDILCFGQDIHASFPLYPLLMIECKAVPLTQAVLEQVIGYNYHVGAYFVAIANQKEIRTFWKEEKEKNYDFLPSFQQLMEAVKTHESF